VSEISAQATTNVSTRFAEWLPSARSLGLATLAALAQALSFAPFHLVFTSLATITLLHLATNNLGYRKIFAIGWWAGFVGQLLIYWWLIDTIAVFGRLPVAVGVVAHLLYSLAMGLHLALTALVATMLMRQARLRPVEAWPIAYVVIFLAVPQLFPLYLGAEYYALAAPWRLNPPDILVVSTLVVMTGAFFGDYLLRGQAAASPPLRVAGWALIFAGLLAISWPRSLPIEPRKLRVAIAQADFPLGHRFNYNEILARYQKLESLYREGVARGAELVVFSESSLPFPYLIHGQAVPAGRPYAREMTDRLNSLVSAAGIPLIANGLSRDGDKVTNRSVFIEPVADGKIRNQIYDKRKLLWFGERVPFRDYWPKSETLFAAVTQHEPGPGPVLWTWNGLTLLPSICYEAILPRFTRAIIPADGRVDLIVNLTNDKWFGLTNEQEQHLMLASWRSAETGIPMIRATLNGVSAVVDGRGETIMRGEQGKSGIWMSDVPLNMMKDVKE